jgi:transcriptional regulator PpsR
VTEGIDPLKPDAGPLSFREAKAALDIFGTPLARNLAEVAGDVTLLIDRVGVVRDIAFGEPGFSNAGLGGWVGQNWIDTVTVESRTKVSALLRHSEGATGRWRQINHVIGDQDVPVRYITLGTNKPGWLVAIGRDMRGAATLQQRLLHTQQAMERDYIRLRQAESRYRLLFNQSSEAILIVDAGTRRVTEANPAAGSIIGGSTDTLTGKAIATLFHADDRDRVIALLGSVSAAENIDAVSLRLSRDARDCSVSATLFRQGRGAYFLVRLSVTSGPQTSRAEAEHRLANVLERMPDAFVMTNGSLDIVAENGAFLDMTQTPRREQLRGESVSRFLGRPGIDLNLLVSQLREHGTVSNFGTILRDRYDEQEEVEVSAVAISEGTEEWFGMTIRRVGRLRDSLPPTEGVTRSVEQLTELVGRVSLKDIVRESTDLIERLCIEAALAYTSDNRASAAEILGLSRQSLYSKLHRHGLANGTAEDSV